MRRHPIRILIATASLLSLSVGVAGVLGVTAHRRHGSGPWWKRSWMFFSLWDQDCRSYGCPARIYAFGWYIELPRLGDDLHDIFEVDSA